MKFSILFLSLFSQNCFSQIINLKLDSKYYQDNIVQKKMKTKVVANLGNNLQIPARFGNPFEMELNLSKINKDLIKLRGEIYLNERGMKKHLTSYSIVTEYKRWAKIKTIKEDGTVFEMKFLPTKI